ncbi:unnamed protein product [Clonostachys byssicola]|uniref:Uncharacterized protein n=1 Tax=Clonostachys byssicola TaxID=160290 RepID=A0A9N9UHJ5_9HYPO|nr:unnamed protein product [Clonostachys byssicola]
MAIASQLPKDCQTTIWVSTSLEMPRARIGQVPGQVPGQRRAGSVPMIQPRLGPYILINAAGLDARTLADIKHSKVQPIRLQSAIFKYPTYREGYGRGDNYYTTAFSHLDGEVYFGGANKPGSDDINAYDDKRQMKQPDVLPSTDLKKAGLVPDHATWVSCKIRKDGGVRVEAATVGGQKVIHAYGQHAGGYTFSYGKAFSPI